jgi:SAM-dependent methyltransferase
MSDRLAKSFARVRGRLRKQLAAGWQRAVFAAPHEAGETERDEELVEGPGALADATDFDERFDALLLRAEAAARAGRVKQVFVLDERRRLELDARHGHVKHKQLDEATLTKLMGGKQRALRPDRSAELLRAIGIMNADGTISARNAKKYKQVNHLVELCRPLWTERERGEPLHIVDLACGNSYLGFVLLEALRLAGIEARLLGIDVREDVIASSRARAEELGFAAQTRFVAASLHSLTHEQLVATPSRDSAPESELGARPGESELGARPGEPSDSIDIALSLHACDSATDAALALAIAAGAEAILCVPCCQAELARVLDARAPGLAGLPPALLEQGLLRRSFAETLTDALRVELLEACGYSVALLEFVGSEHTPKNLLIRAQRRRSMGRRAELGNGAQTRVDPQRWRLESTRERCQALGVEPTLLRLLDDLRARWQPAVGGR